MTFYLIHYAVFLALGCGYYLLIELSLWKDSRRIAAGSGTRRQSNCSGVSERNDS